MATQSTTEDVRAGEARVVPLVAAVGAVVALLLVLFAAALVASEQALADALDAQQVAAVDDAADAAEPTSRLAPANVCPEERRSHVACESVLLGWPRACQWVDVDGNRCGDMWFKLN